MTKNKLLTFKVCNVHCNLVIGKTRFGLFQKIEWKNRFDEKSGVPTWPTLMLSFLFDKDGTYWYLSVILHILLNEVFSIFKTFAETIVRVSS